MKDTFNEKYYIFTTIFLRLSSCPFSRLNLRPTLVLIDDRPLSSIKAKMGIHKYQKKPLPFLKEERG